MTVIIEPPRTPRSTMRVTMMAQVPVAEIAYERSRWVLHLHPLAGQLTTKEKNELLARGSEEVSRLNTLANVTSRLMK